jgi:hypothetical protein
MSNKNPDYFVDMDLCTVVLLHSTNISNFRHIKHVVKELHKSLSLPAAKRVVKVLHKSISRPFSFPVKKLMNFQL